MSDNHPFNKSLYRWRMVWGLGIFMMHYLIYKITNNINGKIYIGQHQTEDLNDGYMGSGQNIKRAINKYGLENFTKEILYYCTDWETMNNMEEIIVDNEFVDRKDTYNLRLGGSHGSFSEETKRKMSETHKNMPEETKRKISEALKGKKPWNTGKKLPRQSEEVIQKRADANKGKKRSEETKRKISEALKGKHPSEESKRKNAEAHIGKGHKQTEDTRIKISQSKKGICTRSKDYRHSNETRIKIGNAQRGKHWYTNGYVNVFDYKCPEGYVKGMTIKIKMKRS